MFELRSKTKWCSPLENDLLSNPPPLWNFLGLWPPHLPGISNSLHNGGLDIFWNLHTLFEIYILLYVFNKNKNIVNAGYWVLSENLRNFGCNISIRRLSIQSLGGREGNKVSARSGGWDMLYFLGGKLCKKWRSHFCQVQKLVYFTNFFSSIS